MQQLRKLSARTLYIYVLATRFVPGLIIIAQRETNARSRMVTVEYVKYVILMKSPQAARCSLVYKFYGVFSRTAHDTYFLVFDYWQLSRSPSEIRRRIFVKLARKHQSLDEKALGKSDEIRVATKGSILSLRKLHNGEQCFDMVNSSVENM